MMSRAQAMSLHPAGALTTAGVEARRAALALEEEGWAGTFLVEPLTALAGGILGGTLVTVAAWRFGWAALERRAAHRIAQALR